MRQADDIALDALTADVQELLGSLVLAEAQWSAELEQVDQSNWSSAVNLVHYWALRQHDLRGLQQNLAAFGLSSLGRSEPHVRATLAAIATAVGALHGRPDVTGHSASAFAAGPLLLAERTAELFGPAPTARPTRIMVTLPPEAATDAALVRALVEHGMNLARINCAHDDAAAWAAMIAHVHAAAAATGRDCRVAMDLSGPKLRTGPLAPGPQVIKLRPARDALGRVTATAKCWLTAAGAPHPAPRAGMAVVPVAASWLAGLVTGDEISLRDAGGSRRHLRVESVQVGGVRASADRTTYLATGTHIGAPGGQKTEVGALAPKAQFLVLRRGQDLVLTRDLSPAPVGGPGVAHIGCTLAEAFDNVQPGHAVHFDDGTITGRVLDADSEHITIRITEAASTGSRLRAGKGINFPDTVLPISALTDADRANLPFIIAHADLVELSFIRQPQDVRDLLSVLEELGDDRLGVIVKIETAQAFDNLPAVLLALLARPHAGVMIARGDLAVECGFERMAELQEEILWLCEAGHLPVIWATQVLDQMARSGLPSRAEITDAAMGERAECVMLNKGPHILDALVALDDILARMSGHHYKKNSLMRPLRSWSLTNSGL